MNRPGEADREPRPHHQPGRISAQYNLASPTGLPARIAQYQRRKMFAALQRFIGGSGRSTVLDIGATGDREFAYSNYVEAWFEPKANLTALGLDDASFLVGQYPGMRFVRADARDLPFCDDSFDYAHSSAVIEHVGGRERQVRCLREAWRVCRKGIFVTTPNRWFPIEFHTLLPLLHWLPPQRHRALLNKLGQGFFASEDNLNLLSGRALAEAAREAGISGVRVDTVALFGWPTNLMLTARKSPASA